MGRITNLVQNPLGPTATSATYYSAINGAATAFVTSPVKGVRITCVAGGVSDSGASFFSGITGVQSGVTYTVSVDVTGEVSDSWRISVQGGWVTAPINSTPVYVGFGETKRIAVTFTTVGTTGSVYVLRSTETVASQAIISKVLVESSTVAGDYFDGDTPPFHYGELAQLVVPKWSGTPGQSSSYFDYELPWTVGIKWDQSMDRRFELGVDRGVLYNRSMVGVSWNGLVNVTEKLTNTELARYYQDGSKYYTDQSKHEFSATIEAYTYPDIFETFTGKTQVVEGLYADEASFYPFHFSYRTKVGDAVYGPDKFYKIHLVYNAYAIPSDRSYGTVNESPSASTFSWDITTDAIAFVPGASSIITSHLIIDSRKVPASKLKNLETILYGTSDISPRLPLPAEVRTILA